MPYKDYFNLIHTEKEKYFIRVSEKGFKEKFEELISEEGSFFDTGDFMKGKLENNRLEIVGKRSNVFKGFFIKIDGSYKTNLDGELELDLLYRVPLQIEIAMKFSMFLVFLMVLLDKTHKSLICIPPFLIFQFSYINMIKEGRVFFEENFLGSFSHVEVLSNDK